MREYKVTAEGLLTLSKDVTPEDAVSEISGKAGETIHAYLHYGTADTASHPVAVIYLLQHSVKMLFGDGMRAVEITKLSEAGDFMELIADEWTVHAELTRTDE